MENNPLGRSNFEAPKTESDKPEAEKSTKKKASRSEAPSNGEKNPQASRDLGQSIIKAESAQSEKSPLFAAIEKVEASRQETVTANESETKLSTEDVEVAATIEQEKPHLTTEIAHSHLEQLVDPDEAAEAPFLERVAAGEDVETAFVEAASELGLSEDEITVALAEMAVIQNDPADIAESPSETNDEVGEVDPAEFSDDDEVAINTATPPGGSGRGSSGGSGGAMPPTPPTPPTSATPPMSSSPPLSRPVAPSPVTRTPNVAPAAAEQHDTQRAKAGQLLLVGLVGYLYGKHRGRLKTEKRLLPARRKLETQVVKLERDISHKEQLLVAAKAKNERSAPKSRVEAPANRPETPLYVAAERTQPGRQETRLGMEKPARAERLGHMVIAAEAPPALKEQPNNLRQAFRPEQVKDMHRNQLLEVSEKIIVEGASLRKIYESNLVGEKQLRHLVSEYLQGKDIRKELRHEMVEHEIDFERDPIMRDRVRSHLAGGGRGGLNEMLASVGIINEASDPELARRVRAEEARIIKKKQRQEHRQRVVADSALVTAVVVLAVAVLILALRS